MFIMTEQKKVEREGAGVAETSDIAAYPAPGRRRRLTAARKQAGGIGRRIG